MAFSTNVFPIKIDLSGKTVWPEASGFQKLYKSDLLSTQIIKVARFARNVEWDFFCNFKTPCSISNIIFLYHRKEEMPVVFLPQDSPEDCQGSEAAMSAFGFLSFAMAVVNGVINAANNINNNNNK